MRKNHPQLLRLIDKNMEVIVIEIIVFFDVKD